MFRVWGKLIKDNHLMKDTVICISDYEMTRTHKVYKALEDMCYEFDLAKPVWLKKNKDELSTTPEPDSQRITLWRI